MRIVEPVLVIRFLAGLLAGSAFSGALAEGPPIFTKAKGLTQGEIRVQVVMLSVDAKDAAAWLLESDGLSVAMERRLIHEVGTSRAVEVTRLTATSTTGVIHQAAPKMIEVILQRYSGSLWASQEDARRRGEPMPDPAMMFEHLEKHGIGPELEAQLPTVPGDPAATVKLQFTYTPEPEERPATNWPLAGGFRAPRVILRPWSIETECRMPPGEPVLLGTQMEPSLEGAVNTGRVWFALGRLDCDEEKARAPAVQTDAPVVKEVDTVAWLFSVPNAFAASWMKQRKDASADAATLREWIAVSHTKGGPAIAAVMHTRAEAAKEGKVAGVRHWEDGTGFEPGSEGSSYRAIAVESGPYELRHELTTSAALNWNDDDKKPVDLFAVHGPELDHVKERAPLPLITVNARFAMPPHPARWKRIESAMEKDPATDPGALELAAVGDEHGEWSVALMHGEVVAAAAWPEAEERRTRVVFLRCQRSQATAPVETRPDVFPARGTAMLWVVDTPTAPWLAKLMSSTTMYDMKLAQKVIGEIAAGRAEMVGALLQQGGQVLRIQGWAGLPMKGVSTQGEGYVSEYLNTQPYPGGLPFNPRSFVSSGPGWDWKWEIEGASSAGVDMTVSLTSPTSPTTSRRWGVWLEQDVRHTPETSGIDLPVRSASSMSAQTVVQWDKPVVLSVVRQEKEGVERLRWTIALANPPRGMTPESLQVVIPGDESYRFSARWVQAMLLSVKPGDAPMFVNGDGKDAGVESRLIQGVADGKVVVIDFTTVAAHLSGGAGASATKTIIYGEPREGIEGCPSGIPREPPPGTVYSDQIGLMQHVSGIRMWFNDEVIGIDHDGAFEVVTDTLLGEYEFPRAPEGLSQEPVSVSVQRPVFTPHRSQTPLPTKGGAVIVPWAGSPPPNGEKWFFLVRSPGSEPRW
jgi:hypothetical protein